MAFLDHYSDIVSKIEKEIDKYVNEKIDGNENPVLDEFYHLIKKHALSGGKRLRPLALAMAYRCFRDDDEIMAPSISPELVHLSSLILDDAMDEDIVRHGESTFNAAYADKFLEAMNFDFSKYDRGSYWVGRDALKELFFAQRTISRHSYAFSVLGSNVMYAMSLETLLRCNFDNSLKLKVIGLHTEMYQKLNEGQLLDIMYELASISEKAYLDMIRKKTGILFVYPVRMGLTFSGVKNINMLDDYAILMAEAFQIWDDILGTFGSEEVTGKPSHSDIIEGKRTLLVIKSLENASDSQKKKLGEVLGYEAAPKEDIAEVKEIFKETGAYDYCIKLAKDLVTRSEESIPQDISDESREFFSGLADFVVSRDR
ncbi:MAG: polyprenyl synthetase family protein [Candidatus Methanofastidiosia archaeon]